MMLEPFSGLGIDETSSSEVRHLLILRTLLTCTQY